MIKPLPCPWCGEKEAVEPSYNGVYWVECFYCGATGPTENLRDRAIEAWNSLPRQSPWLDPTAELEDFRNFLAETIEACIQNASNRHDGVFNSDQIADAIINNLPWRKTGGRDD